jgi:hypothetical protein
MDEYHALTPLPSASISTRRGAEPLGAAKAEAELEIGSKKFEINYPNYCYYGIYSTGPYDMNNIDLLLFSLSPLSFLAFVILPAIFGLIF